MGLMVEGWRLPSGCIPLGLDLRGDYCIIHVGGSPSEGQSTVVVVVFRTSVLQQQHYIITKPVLSYDPFMISPSTRFYNLLASQMLTYACVGRNCETVCGQLSDGL